MADPGRSQDFSVDVESPRPCLVSRLRCLLLPALVSGAGAPEALAILAGYDLASLGPNSADTLHLIPER